MSPAMKDVAGLNLAGIPSVYLNQLGNSNSTPTVSAYKVNLQQGQIVQATVLKLLPGQLATVALGGLILTALLETPLQIGQKAWLQVESDGEMPTLKILEQPTSSTNLSSSTLPDPTLEGLLDALQIDLTKEQKDIMKMSQEKNIPLTKDFLQAIPRIMGELGATSETLEAMALVNQKGLPLTKETVQSVKTFLSNQSLDKQIDQLLKKLDSERALKQSEAIDSTSDLDKQLQQIKMQLTNLKQTILSLQRYIQGSDLISNPSGTANSERTTIDQGSIDKLVDSVRGLLSSNRDIEPSAIDTRTLSLIPDSSLDTAATDIDRSVPNGAKSPASVNPSTVPVDDSVHQPKDLIAELLQNLGLDHESNLVQSNDYTTQRELANAQSLKAAILQILQHPAADHLTAEVKQDLQQLVHHITGQQLLIGNETSPVFSQISLQIPIPGVRYEQNAMVHVEARKKANGTIDTENCRLFFYLTMQHIGETMLDVTIVNKIVSISLYNDQPWIVHIVKESQNKLKEALTDQGYYVSQIKILPVPSNPGQFIKAPPKSLADYKGVDIKI